MSAPADLQIIAAWLTKLADLTVSSRDDRRAMGDKLALYATMLGRNFEVKAFTQRSLEAVALECKFWPAYGELAQHLAAWWKDNRPSLLALAAPQRQWREPERPDPTPEESAYVCAIVADLVAETNARRKPVIGNPDRHVTKPIDPATLAAIRRRDLGGQS
jgi:hypothetical protein